MPSDMDKSYGGYSTFRPHRHAEGDEGASYRSLSDAAAATGNRSYGKPGTLIFYYRRGMGRDLGMGGRWLEEQGMLPTAKSLRKTHVLVGQVGEKNKNRVMEMMQGEVWSPRGEARDFIRKSGLGHTSMSVGDVMVQGGKLFLVDTFGFRELS